MTSAATGTPIDARVYMIDPRHKVAAAAFGAQPGRYWLVLLGTVFPRDVSGRVLVMADMVASDGAGQLVDQASGRHLELLREIAPGAALMGFFPAPPEGYGVAVLRITR